MDDKPAWCTCRPFPWSSRSFYDDDAPIPAHKTDSNSLENEMLLDNEVVPTRARSAPQRCCGIPCRHCCCICTSCCLAPVVIGVLAALIFLYLTESLCAVETYDVDSVVPTKAEQANLSAPMELATSDNIKTHIPLDFTGIWWMRWSDPKVTGGVWTNVTYSLYSSLRIEELVSFAGYASNVSGDHGAWFPARLGMQTGLKRRSGFSDSIFGRIMMMVSSGLSPTALLNIDFVNETSGRFVGFGEAIYLTKLDEDQWIRTTKVHGNPNGAPAYRFTRIVTGDGKPHPKYFPLFKEHMGSAKLRVWTTDDPCYRSKGTCPSSESCKAIKKSCEEA